MTRSIDSDIADEIRRERDGLRAAFEALREDALRYRWLREHAARPTLAAIAWGHSKAACQFSDPDEAIDAAILETTPDDL
jgi:hypothetical protein